MVWWMLLACAGAAVESDTESIASAFESESDGSDYPHSGGVPG